MGVVYGIGDDGIFPPLALVLVLLLPKLDPRAVLGLLLPYIPEEEAADMGMGMLDGRDGDPIMPIPILEVDKAGEEPRGRLYGSNRSSICAFRLPGRTEAEPPVDSRYCIRLGLLDIALGEVASWYLVSLRT